MVKMTDRNGLARFVAASAIASISEASASCRWHGTRAIVKLFDGTLIETQESATDLARAVADLTIAGAA